MLIRVGRYDKIYSQVFYWLDEPNISIWVFYLSQLNFQKMNDTSPYTVYCSCNIKLPIHSSVWSVSPTPNANAYQLIWWGNIREQYQFGKKTKKHQCIFSADLTLRMWDVPGWTRFLLLAINRHECTFYYSLTLEKMVAVLQTLFRPAEERSAFKE